MKPKQFIPKLTSCRVGSHDKLGLLGEKVVKRMPKGWSFTSLLLHFLSHTLSFPSSICLYRWEMNITGEGNFFLTMLH